MRHFCANPGSASQGLSHPRPYDAPCSTRSNLAAAMNRTHPPINAITPTPMARPAQNPPAVGDVSAA